MSEARANVPTVFLHMPIGTNSLSVPIVDSIWEALPITVRTKPILLAQFFVLQANTDAANGKMK